ncbi:uncharacterized protein LOC127866269 [Dreissena polymorpha]|uniref:Uncharacterized protein n=1 Tax=Dreissena polymorpha TaxID=45954 RepID=A0A9D4LRL5_DREPO|nr:uncharacterized protein LOC127866269 [Dreissena polymorpha]KAH3862503.1 hypothetical protein DPMN_025470 [Dreissena polymorpha]
MLRDANIMMTAEVLFGVFAALFATVGGSVNCGHTVCYGSGAYCCENDLQECCWQHFPVYTFWWFWSIWFWVIFFGVLICVCIRRRRRLLSAPRYVIVEGQQSYGTVQASYQRAAYDQGFNPAMSAPAYQEKPPEYSAVVNH